MLIVSIAFYQRNAFQLFTTLNLAETPAPGSYQLKSTVGNSIPTIVGNTLTTSFKNQASRSAFDKVYVPGGRSVKGYEYIPGPGAYKVRNKEIGTDFPKCSIRNKINNLMGKFLCCTNE